MAASITLHSPPILIVAGKGIGRGDKARSRPESTLWKDMRNTAKPGAVEPFMDDCQQSELTLISACG